MTYLRGSISRPAYVHRLHDTLINILLIAFLAYCDQRGVFVSRKRDLLLLESAQGAGSVHGRDCSCVCCHRSVLRFMNVSRCPEYFPDIWFMKSAVLKLSKDCECIKGADPMCLMFLLENRRSAGRGVRRPDCTLATVDHNILYVVCVSP